MHVIDSGGLYGAEIMLLGLMDEQRRSGDHPLLCSIGTPGEDEKDIEREAEQNGHNVFRMRMARGFSVRGACDLLRIARERGADVIHSHGYKSDILLGSLTRKLRRLPMVSTLHGWTSMTKFSKMRLYELLDCVSLNGVDAVITVNGAVQNTARFRWCLNKRVRCIPNGIPDSKVFSSPPPSDDPAVSFCSGHFVVGALGRLSVEKGYDTLIRAFGHLHETVPKARLIIIGEGDERSRLESLIKQLSLDGSVLMPGFRHQARQYLQMFSCFVISSLTEGLPISLLEAMSAGTPVISTDVGGIAEALDFGKAGTLVPAGDLDGLSAALLSVCKNPLPAIRKSAVAKEIVRSRYSSKKMAQSYRDVYSDLIAAS